MQEYSQNIFNLTIPVLALDIVIFTVYKDKLCVVLVNKQDEPESGKLILPGWVVRSTVSLEDNFDKILQTKTGISWVYKEQLYTFWNPDRDPRWHVVSVSYYALVWWEKFLNQIDLTKVQIVEFDKLISSQIWFDHLEIIKYAKQRLNWKLEYTNISQNILPKYFTFSQLQKVYEIVLGKEIDKRNFRKKILSLDIIKETWEVDRIMSNRPSKLYEFIDKDLKIIDIL